MKSGEIINLMGRISSSNLLFKSGLSCFQYFDRRGCPGSLCRSSHSQPHFTGKPEPTECSCLFKSAGRSISQATAVSVQKQCLQGIYEGYKAHFFSSEDGAPTASTLLDRTGGNLMGSFILVHGRRKLHPPHSSHYCSFGVKVLYNSILLSCQLLCPSHTYASQG